MIGIYKITSPTNRIYIGQSVDIEKRFQKYEKLNCKGQRKIFNSLNKHGLEKHIFEVAEECNVEQLTDREGYWQDFYDCVDKGLNCRRVTTSDKSGYDSEETKERRSLSQKGIPKPYSENRIPWAASEETKQLMRENHADFSGANNPKAKGVENSITREFFTTIREAAKSENISEGLLLSYLTGRLFNKTNLRFIDEKLRPPVNVIIYGGSKLVLDQQAGIFYYSAKEAAEAYGVNHSTLKSMLNPNGKCKNKTSLIYV